MAYLTRIIYAADYPDVLEFTEDFARDIALDNFEYDCRFQDGWIDYDSVEMCPVYGDDDETVIAYEVEAMLDYDSDYAIDDSY